MTVAAEGNGAGGGDPIFYTLSGPEDQIQAGADKLAAFIAPIPGTVNVQTGAESEGDRLERQHRSRASARCSASSPATRRPRLASQSAARSRRACAPTTGLVDVRVQLTRGCRETISPTSRKIRVRANDGVSIYRLGDVASFSYDRRRRRSSGSTSSASSRVTRRHRSGRDDARRRDAEDRRGGRSSPASSRTASRCARNGDSQFFAETFSSMGIALLTSFSLVYVLMVILYSSFLTPFVIMFSVPLALVGALYGLA